MIHGKKNILFQQNIFLKGLIEIGIKLKFKLEILMEKLVSIIKKYLILSWKEFVKEWNRNGTKKLNFPQREIGKVKVILENRHNFTTKISKDKETLWITEKLKTFFFQLYFFSLFFTYISNLFTFFFIIFFIILSNHNYIDY